MAAAGGTSESWAAAAATVRASDADAAVTEARRTARAAANRAGRDPVQAQGGPARGTEPVVRGAGPAAAVSDMVLCGDGPSLRHEPRPARGAESVVLAAAVKRHGAVQRGGAA